MSMMKLNAQIFAILFTSLAIFTTGSPRTCMRYVSETMSKFDTEISIFPGEEQLAEICPPFREMARCFHNLQLTDIDDDDKEEVKSFRIFISALESLCTENSTLRKNYLDQVVCLRRSEEVIPFCQQMSTSVYNFYLLSKGKEESLPEEKICFEEAFVTGCMSDFISENCGLRDLSTFQFFAKKYLTAFCSSEAAEALPTKFFKSIYFKQLSKEKRKLFEEIFNLAESD